MIELRPYQQEAVNNLCFHTRGIVKAPAGAGKTIIMAAAIDKWLREDTGLAVIWYANTVEQCAQAEEACQAFDLRSRLGKLTICCYQSGELAHSYNLAVCDECHHIASPEFRKLVTDYRGVRWGCSATPDRADELKEDVFKLIGPLIYEVDRAELVESGKLARARVIFHAPNEKNELEAPIEEQAEAGAKQMAYAIQHNVYKLAQKSIESVTRLLGSEVKMAALILAEQRGYGPEAKMELLRDTVEGSRWLITAAKQELLSRARWQACQARGIFENEPRNRVISQVALGHLLVDGSEDSVLILVGSIEHGKLLQSTITDSLVLHSKMGAKARREAMEAFRSGKLRCAIATSLADEGLDVPRASVLILAAAGRSAGKAEQRTGRVLRAWGDKTHGTIHDFWDHQHPLLRNQSRARAKVYAGLDYEFVGDGEILPTVLKSIGITMHPATGMQMPHEKKNLSSSVLSDVQDERPRGSEVGVSRPQSEDVRFVSAATPTKGTSDAAQFSETLKSKPSGQSVSQVPSNGIGKELRQQQTVTSRESSGLSGGVAADTPENLNTSREISGRAESEAPTTQYISEEKNLQVASTHVNSQSRGNHDSKCTTPPDRITGCRVADLSQDPAERYLLEERTLSGQIQNGPPVFVRGDRPEMSGVPPSRARSEEIQRVEHDPEGPRLHKSGDSQVHSSLCELSPEATSKIPQEQPVDMTPQNTNLKAAAPTQPLAHTERAHARLSPSTLESKAKCPGFKNDPTRDKTAANRGTLGHEAVEKSKPELAGEDLPLKTGVLKCISYRNAVYDRYPETPKVYQEIKLHYFEQWGFCDILMFLGDEADLLDWKFAFNFYGADRPQFHAYCIGVWNKFPQIETIRVHVGHPFLNAIDTETFTRTEHYEKFGGEIAAIMAKADRNDPAEYQISSQCAYCGHAVNCTKLGNLGLELGRRYATELSLPEGSLHGSEITDPAAFASLLRLAPIVESAASGWRRGAMDLYSSGKEIPGFKAIKRSGKRSIASAAKAYEIIVNNFAKDLPVEKFLDACTVTATGLDDIVAAATPKGGKEKAKIRLAAHLEDENILENAKGSHFLKEVKEHKPADDADYSEHTDEEVA